MISEAFTLLWENGGTKPVVEPVKIHAKRRDDYIVEFLNRKFSPKYHQIGTSALWFTFEEAQTVADMKRDKIYERNQKGMH